MNLSTKRKDSYSIAAFEQAKRVIPGGVNSPVRAFSAVDLTPVLAARGQGARVFDIDGNKFIDYIWSWGPLILGHAHPEVVVAIKKAASRGTSFGLSTEVEIKMAEWIYKSMPSIEIGAHGEFRYESFNERIAISKRLYEAAKNRKISRRIPRTCRCVINQVRIGHRYHGITG